MPLVPIENVGVLGIVKDLPSYELPPEAWSDGDNVVFVDGKVQKATGHKDVFGATTVAPYFVLGVPSATLFFWIYGGLTKVYVTDAASHFNLTRQTASVDVDYSANVTDKWNGAVVGGIPIINNGVDVPQMWLPVQTSQRLLNLTAWPAGLTAKVIRSFKNHVFALNVTESGTNFSRVYRWSHPAQPGAVPSSWDITDNTLDAGRSPIPDARGSLLDLLPLPRGNAILYAEDSAFSIQFIGRPEIFRTDPLPIGLALLATGTVTRYPSGHFVATPDDIVVTDGLSARSVVSRRIRRSIFNLLDANNKARSFCVTNIKANECWFVFTATGDVQPTMAFVWNWVEDTSQLRSLGSEIAHADTGIVDDSVVSTVWNNQTGRIWDLQSDVWDARQFDPNYTSLLLARNAANAVSLADSTETQATVAMLSFVERRGLTLVGRDRAGNPKSDPSTVKYVSRIIPKMVGTGPVSVSVGGQMTREGPNTISGPHVFDPNVDQDIPINAKGRYISVRFESSTDITWNLSGYQLDVHVLGDY